MQQQSIDSNFNKNDKQLFFNLIKGVIEEINVAEEWCSYTLKVGHENQRLVNLSLKKKQYERFRDMFSVGEKVIIKYYLTSRYKNERWHTNANILDISVAIP